jgi:hypothetical protein
MVGFYREWLVLAFRSPWGLSDSIATVLGLAVPLVGRVVPSWASAMQDLVWQIPLGILSALAVVRLVIAPYWMIQQARQDSEAQRAELRLEIERLGGELARVSRELTSRAPDFRGTLDHVAFGEVKGTATVTVILSLRNRGGSASLAERFGMQVNCDGKWRPVELIWPDTLTLEIDRGRSEVLTKDDLIVAKTVRPVEPGSAVRGFLVGFAHGVSRGELARSGTRLRVGLSDINEKRHEIEWSVDDSTVSEGLGFQPGMEMGRNDTEA